MNFKSFYESNESGFMNPNVVSLAQGARRKGASAQNVGPSLGSKHQNMVRKQDKVIGERKHPQVEKFIKMGLQQQDVTQFANEILTAYDLSNINPGEERQINSNPDSPVKIRNENGRFFLIK